MGAAFIVIFAVGFVGNSLLVVVLTRQRRAWISTMMYVLNLAVSDLLFVSTMPLWAWAYMHRMRWPFGVLMCKLCGTVPTFNMFSSVFFLSAIAVDRWLAVVHSNDAARKYRSWPAVRRVCLMVWTASLFLVLYRIPLMTLQHLDVNGTIIADSEGRNGTPVCVFFIAPGPNKFTIEGALELGVATLGFFVPVGVMGFCYARIIVTVKRKAMDGSKRSPINRVLLLGLVVMAAFVACWLPSQLLRLYSAVAGWWNVGSFSPELYHQLYPLTLCLAWSNSIMNPLIYSLTLSNTRASFLNLFGLSRLSQRRLTSSTCHHHQHRHHRNRLGCHSKVRL